MGNCFAGYFDPEKKSIVTRADFDKFKTILVYGIDEFLKNVLENHLESKGISGVHVKKVLLPRGLDFAIVEISDHEVVDSLLKYEDLGPLRLQRYTGALPSSATEAKRKDEVDSSRGREAAYHDHPSNRGPRKDLENPEGSSGSRSSWWDTVDYYTGASKFYSYVTGSNSGNRDKSHGIHVETLVMRFISVYLWSEYEKLKSVCKEMKYTKEDKWEILHLFPDESVDEKTFQRTVDDFIEVYKNIYAKMHQEVLEVNTSRVQKPQQCHVMSETWKRFSVILSERQDEGTCVVFGERENVLQAVEYMRRQLGIPDRIPTSMSVVNPKNGLSCRISDSVTIRAYYGDITEEDTDAIVNPANENLDHGGGAAYAIVNRGGKSIQDESNDIMRKRKRPLQPGDVEVTTSGRLPCKFVIHAVGPRWNGDERRCRSLLHRACINSLENALRNGAKSIAIPAISAGVFGVPQEICAQVLYSAVEEFSNRYKHERRIEEVHFVNIDMPTVQVFQQEMKKRYMNGKVNPNELAPSSSSYKAIAHYNEPRYQPAANYVKNSQELSYPNQSKKRASQEQWHGQQKKNSYGEYSGPGNKSNPQYSTVQAFTVPSAYKVVQQNSSDKNSPSQNLMLNDNQSHQYPSAKSGNTPNYARDKDASGDCCICLEKMKNPKTLSKCKHSFCSECVEEAFKRRNVCPVCFTVYGEITGNQPYGKMTWYKQSESLPGYGRVGTIIIQYNFPSGIQGENHPNPGQKYHGTSRTAFLPDNEEGNKVLRLLKRAFDQRLTFTIGTSVTTQSPNQITWNDIHHKTNPHGGATAYGYPDPDYLRRVQEELAAKGIQ